MLRGATAPLGLIFPEEGLGAADLYSSAPAFRMMNAMLAGAVGGVVGELPPGRRLRVLEVGAGTGGGTGAVLPLLPAEACDYAFTDVSAGFFAAAEARFADYPFLACRPLDIERDPLAQGYAAGGYDLIVASNVLHATCDLVAALGHCRTLLAPGGALLLVEEMQRRGWADLTFGMLDGWWRFTDRALRPEHALLDPAGWERALDAAGYGEARVLHPDDARVQGLVLARAPVDASPGQWLLAGGGARGAALAQALRDHGQQVIEVAADAAPARLARLAPAPVLRGVVHLAALEDDGIPGEIDTAGLAARTEAVAGSALALAQALLARGEAPADGLWLVSAGAQSVAGEPAGPGASSMAGSVLWGMARSLSREHPELQVRRIDLEAEPDAEAADAGADAAALLAGSWRPIARTRSRAGAGAGWRRGWCARARRRRAGWRCRRRRAGGSPRAPAARWRSSGSSRWAPRSGPRSPTWRRVRTRWWWLSRRPGSTSATCSTRSAWCRSTPGRSAPSSPAGCSRWAPKSPASLSASGWWGWDRAASATG